jgi:predicted AlkP superfamily phosphohydrolase/phosphomutase
MSYTSRPEQWNYSINHFPLLLEHGQLHDVKSTIPTISPCFWSMGICCEQHNTGWWREQLLEFTQ